MVLSSLKAWCFQAKHGAFKLGSSLRRLALGAYAMTNSTPSSTPPGGGPGDSGAAGPGGITPLDGDTENSPGDSGVKCAVNALARE